MAMAEESEERMMRMQEDETNARDLRAATLRAEDVAEAYLEPCSVDEFMLQPGERMVVPVQWDCHGGEKAYACSTHPDAPAGLKVLPGICSGEERMSLIVENESQLAVHVPEIMKSFKLVVCLKD